MLTESAEIPDAALNALAAGQVIAFPTETVYGLAADATQASAIQALYRFKGRNQKQPLQLLVPDVAMAQALVGFNPVATTLAKAFWPGPLTIILKKLSKSPVHDHINRTDDTLGVRCPDHPTAQAILRAYGKPLAASSANPATKPPATTASETHRYFGDKLLILDGGTAGLGSPSTIVKCVKLEPEILRIGALSELAIEDALAF